MSNRWQTAWMLIALLAVISFGIVGFGIIKLAENTQHKSAAIASLPESGVAARKSAAFSQKQYYWAVHPMWDDVLCCYEVDPVTHRVRVYNIHPKKRVTLEELRGPTVLTQYYSEISGEDVYLGSRTFSRNHEAWPQRKPPEKLPPSLEYEPADDK